MRDETTPGNKPPAEAAKYDQDFFLALAAKGKEAWNAWRRDQANKDVHVTFARVDFSQPPNDAINFEDFDFGNYADFSDCKWRTAVYKGAIFGDYTKFGNAICDGWGDFTGAIFGFGVQFCSTDFRGGANFMGTTFSHVANFNGATFGTGVSFERAIFGHNAKFEGVSLGYKAIFKQTIFGDDVTFDGADFGSEASFEQAIFYGHVNFKGRSNDDWDSIFQRPLASSNAQYIELLSTLKTRHIDLWTRYQSGPGCFLDTSFADARFVGKADFSGRSFERPSIFTNASFYYPPNFDTITNAGRIDFTGAQVGFNPPGKRWRHWTTNSEILVRLRAFRKIAEETKNHDLERDLYIEERKAERGVYGRQLLDELKRAPGELKKQLEDINNQKRDAWSERRLQRRARNAYWLEIAAKIARLFRHCLWIIVMGVYFAFADYGRSLWRPFLAWLLLTFIAFPWLYNQLLLPPSKTVDAGQYEQAVQTVARANAVPFVGSLTIDADIKKVLFCEKENSNNCHPVPSKYYQWAVIGQNLLSILLVFFIGLALRNYFKIK
jgi:uncharacterized protein YjbI with pentapeptide repeats